MEECTAQAIEQGQHDSKELPGALLSDPCKRVCSGFNSDIFGIQQPDPDVGRNKKTGCDDPKHNFILEYFAGEEDDR